MIPPDFCPLTASDAELEQWIALDRPTQEQLPHALTLRIDEDDESDIDHPGNPNNFGSD